MSLRTLFLMYISIQFINVAFSQDCIHYGLRCGDSGQCCGGCCIEGVCTETYRLCHELTNPCREMYCPPGMECTLFMPPDCPGCDVQAICR